MVDLVNITDEQIIDDYLKANDVRLTYINAQDIPASKYIGFSTHLKKKNYIKRVYYQIKMEAETQRQKYLECSRSKLGNTQVGLFSLNKWCVIGSDIHHNGLLAPLQMQLSGRKRFTAHPGGDRIYMLHAMNYQQIPVMWDVKDFWHPHMPELSYTQIRDVVTLKSIFKNWDTSLIFIENFKIGDSPRVHQAFMRVIANNLKKLVDEEILTRDNVTYQRFEIKNSKELFEQIMKTKDLFLNQLEVNTDNVRAGPWTLYENGRLEWDSSGVWKPKKYMLDSNIGC